MSLFQIQMLYSNNMEISWKMAGKDIKECGRSTFYGSRYLRGDIE
jgi:hypothetical protein